MEKQIHNSGYSQSRGQMMLQAKQHHFFPGLFFYVYIESPNRKINPEGPTPQAPNPTKWKPQPQKPYIRPQPQTPRNEQK